MGDFWQANVPFDVHGDNTEGEITSAILDAAVSVAPPNFSGVVASASTRRQLVVITCTVEADDEATVRDQLAEFGEAIEAAQHDRADQAAEVELVSC